VPPTDDTKATTPKAVDRLFLNQWAMMAITGPNMKPDDTYGRRPVSDRWSANAKIHSTHANAKALAEQKLPVRMTLCNQERAHNKDYRCYDHGGVEVADV
jgi:hypothetical protein